ncbi:glycosyltransferase family 4 protein, partial [Vicingaceae bacterium]|nr:glycosyltransferase family 4 protein [Vicingaceae bacterium]
FIAIHRPDRSPSQRFRFEQYLSFLKQNGWDYDFSNLISEKDDQFFYQKGYVLQKAFIFFKSIFIRISDVIKASKYDVVFIQREAFFTGSTFFEKAFSRSKAKVVFDFDDSIWLPNVSEANKKLEWLKNGHKTKEIIALSDLIIVGNQYLAAYAQEFNNNVVVIPTTIDLNYHKKMEVEVSDKITIGWTGTSTTLGYLEEKLSVLGRLKSQFKERIAFKIIVEVDKTYDAIKTTTTQWNKEDEIKDLNGIDIGIMPLPDNQWTKGKCGFKGLQYMALGIPTIMSPVGVNSEIIIHGENGFLADTDQEWFDLLSQLIESVQLRKELGVKGKKTIENRYSVESQKGIYLSELEKLILTK